MVSVPAEYGGDFKGDHDPELALAPSAEAAATARASLEATIACLDGLGLNQIAAHASLALERLNEQFPASSDMAD